VVIYPKIGMINFVALSHKCRGSVKNFTGVHKIFVKLSILITFGTSYCRNEEDMLFMGCSVCYIFILCVSCCSYCTKLAVYKLYFQLEDNIIWNVIMAWCQNFPRPTIFLLLALWWTL